MVVQGGHPGVRRLSCLPPAPLQPFLIPRGCLNGASLSPASRQNGCFGGPYWQPLEVWFWPGQGKEVPGEGMGYARLTVFSGEPLSPEVLRSWVLPGKMKDETAQMPPSCPWFWVSPRT